MKLTAPTHHISAKPGEFAKTVLMPGDPLRAKFIADTFMENVVEVNAIRCMYAYTGDYKGRRVSVMASGMGGSSLATHAYELYNLYDVDSIIRVGTAGGLVQDMELFDIVIAMGACHDSSYHEQYKLPGSFAPLASYPLMRRAIDKADEMKIPYRVGNVFSANSFYNDAPDDIRKWARMGALCVEMETSTLYLTAASAGKNALSLLTISDHLFKEGKMSPEARQDGCLAMMELALETAQ